MSEERGESVQKTLPIRGEPRLEPRPDDRVVDAKMLQEFGLFNRMKKKFSVEKLPGSILLRSYRQGEVIFQQGQAGGTAFYIPTDVELSRLNSPDAMKSAEKSRVEGESRRQILSAMIISSTSKTRPRGILERLFSPATKEKTPPVVAIPSDGPTDINYETREAPLMEGDLFGEMSCISFTPRSATVIARADCQLVEFTRSVFDKVREDPNHLAAVEDEYRRRTLETHLRQFELFRDLSESQIQILKDNVNLEIVRPGKVICEEHEPWNDSQPLDVFIVRNGIVQVSIHTSLSLRNEDILNWPNWCRKLNDSRPDSKSSVAAVAKPGLSHPLTANVGSAASLGPKPTSMPASFGTEMRVSEKLTRAAEPPVAIPIGEKPPETGGSPQKRSPIEEMRAKKAAAAILEAGLAPATAEQSVASLDIDRPTDAVAPPKKLSPIEEMRARKAAAAFEVAQTRIPAEPVIPSPVVETLAETVTPPKKLSPIEEMRARKAAAALEAGQSPMPTEAVIPRPVAEKPAETVTPPKTLSPIEEMRARKAVGVAFEAGPAPIASEKSVNQVSSENVPDAVSAPRKLSPIEAMRAKKAALDSATTPKPVTDFIPVSTSNTNPASSPAVASGGGLPVPAPAIPPAKVGPSVEPTKRPSLLRKPSAGQTGDSTYLVKSWMSDRALEAIRQIACEELHDATLLDAQQLVLSAVNELMGEIEFLSDARLIADVYSAPELVRKIATFPKGLKGIRENWSELELRSTGRTAVSEIFPADIRKPKQAAGPPRVLAYLSRGDCFGEIAVVRREARKATCIAYNHPSSEEVRDFGNVELVRIRGSAFRQLIDESPKLRKQVEELAAKRVSEVQTSDSSHTETELIASTEFQQMGLFQGSKLLVIDLDSCTRCGDCVDACVKTHDDGYSRLFLDGPRYDRFLVPSACRNCLNPVCMIGCPVGSIGRGSNGQIEIFDWCIGCSMCADQCPYDSIQMHDVGLIPEESMGWLYSDSTALPQDWQKSLRLSGGWKQGRSPFLWQGDLLQQWSTSQQQLSDKDPLHLYFRHEFRLPKHSHAGRYRLSINDARRKGAVQKTRVKTSKIVSAWLNGEKLELSGSSIDLTSEQFVPKVNLLAIEIALDMPAEYGQFVLSACLDAIPEASKLAFDVLGKDVRPEMDLVTRRAAVCDLCSHIPSQQPACVSSCPHDAAIRINPLVNFPR